MLCRCLQMAMEARDGGQICTETLRAGALLAAIAETAFSKDMGAHKPLLGAAGEEHMPSSRLNCDSSRFLAGGGGAASPNAAADSAADESRRILLSCSLAGARGGKKKRRSRASNKAPIKVYSTDTSNFMAMVHKLTGIPSNVPPFLSSLPSLWTTPAQRMLPFNQGLSTLDTSTLLLPTLSCDRVLSGSGFSGMQALPTQPHLGSISSSLKTSGQAGQPALNMDYIPSSYSDLVRSMSSSIDSSSLLRSWDAAYTSQKTAAHQLPRISFSETEVLMSQKVPHQGMSRELNRPTSGTMSGLDLLLAGQDKLASTSVSGPISCITKEELL